MSRLCKRHIFKNALLHIVLMTEFVVYKARFTPKPVDDYGHADLDTAHLFEKEMSTRLNYLGSELVRIGGSMQISPDRRMLTIKGSVVQTKAESVKFYLAGFKDTERAESPDERYSCEVEMALAVNSAKISSWARELLESGLPPTVTVERELKYITVKEKQDGMPDINFADYLMI